MSLMPQSILLDTRIPIKVITADKNVKAVIMRMIQRLFRLLIQMEATSTTTINRAIPDTTELRIIIARTASSESPLIKDRHDPVLKQTVQRADVDPSELRTHSLLAVEITSRTNPVSRKQQPRQSRGSIILRVTS
uniref:Uncharacterized protein n=1 Tax=Arion vulgaris TaxID=1028688 RepID=A0A0B7B2A3_9EUPU